MEVFNVEIYSSIILIILIFDYITKFKKEFTIASNVWFTISITALLISISNILLSVSNIYTVKLISQIIYLLSTITCSLFIYIYVKYVFIDSKIDIRKEFSYAFLYIALCVIFTSGYVFFTSNYILHSFDRHFFKKLLMLALIPNAVICIQYIKSELEKKKKLNLKLIVTLLLTIIGLFIDFKNDSLFFVSATFTITALMLYINKHETLLYTDPLTGLLNKRSLENFIHHLKPDKKIVAFNIDVNKFKLINDTYGHFKGDIVLKSVARILKASCKEKDLVIRNGGDEFLIIAIVKNELDGNIIKSRIDDNLDHYNKNAKIKIGLSIGWKIFISGEKTTYKEFNKFLKEIDEMMYEQKELAHKNSKN